MIEIKSLTKKFGKLIAVDNVSLTIDNNKCFALLGLNGAGKTTLINILTTVILPTSGTAVIDGYDLLKDSGEIKKIINVSPQEVAVAQNLAVNENLNLIADLYGINDKQNKILQIVKDFGLDEKLDVQAKKLSGGQLKRLSIALAVITEPKILFLDEPTLGLDVKARQILWGMIEKLKSKMTIFLTTHYLEEVKALTDEIAIISRGKIITKGTIDDILNFSGKSNLEDAFISLTEEE